MELKSSLCIFAVCFLAVLAVPTPCNSPKDCAANECCINLMKPDGKRFVDLGMQGRCQQLGTEISECYVRYGSASQPPDQLVFGCPCSSPLICKGRGIYDMPLGELGCYVRYGSASQPPDQLVFGCPCSSPLICKGRGFYDVPLGELGYCTDPQ
ncbi:Hypothetical predicted protein [Mytilus galloprovincialis]|uniref:Prokineticin domain-containing protein n=1 Tax=Mytilus galloprovincialis TaxID=29158 RepID=A0A8B6C5X5_MYTGA|nr:Hypothetical predicted protein [Mytilus galloprovincialis]